jgi:hypothetical protein
MRSDTKAITIQAKPEKVASFLADPRNLPRWAVGFAKAVREDRGRWLVQTGAGEMGIRVEADSSRGVVDFCMEPAPGVEARACSRVLPNGAGAEYVFTQFQQPGMPDDAFQASVAALGHELTVLRALLEVECPL